MEDTFFSEIVNGHTFMMNLIPEGTFDMGDEHGDLRDACRPVQKGINIAPFYLAEYPVTQALWKAVMVDEDNPSRFKGDSRPVESISWDEVQVFLKALNKTEAAQERQKKDGLLYRLPSEAQWEYAARSGKNEPEIRFAGSNNLKEAGWFTSNSNGETKPVGLKLPNELGLYDMSGNVDEWCADDWKDSLEGTPADGSSRKVKGENRRMVRGGSWGYFGNDCRVALRDWYGSDFRNYFIGFRLARY